MIRRVDLRGQGALDHRAVVPRAAFDIESALDVVRPICDAVRHRGVQAVNEYTARFDGVELTDIAVPAAALHRALEVLDPDVRAGLEESVRRLRLTCEAELERDVTTTVVPGGRVSQMMVPIQRVGLYVPGGIAPLVSSVVMNVVPAQVAGVGSIALASSPRADHDGLPHPTILAACALLGVEEVYAVGGAQAIAMFAYGAGPCRKVDLVTGPGNIYTVSAKRLLKGVVGIDSEALIDAVEAELTRQVASTKHEQRVLTALTGEQSGVVLVDDLEQGLDVVNAYAAEHLEIQTADAAAVAARVHNAGAVFVGSFTPVSLGDYCAGSNHVLPTAGCACHSSGLSVRAFLKAVHVVDYSREALAEVAGHVVALAEAEDLPAHGRAVQVRFER
jgi:histidinol dehydrogenase